MKIIKQNAGRKPVGVFCGKPPNSGEFGGSDTLLTHDCRAMARRLKKARGKDFIQKR